MKIKKINVTSQVVEYMKENIEAGEWEVGKKIPSENQMIAELGVSRASIRSALQYLSGIGVLESFQGKGTFLINDHVENWNEADSKITSEDCRNIYRVLEFRGILEPEVCRMAVRNSTAETVAILEKYLEQMKQFRGDQAKFVRADLKFHEAICQCFGNPLVEKSLHKVYVETRKNHEQMNEIFGYESGIHYHTEIVDAFRDHDEQKAFEVMKQHIDEALEKIHSLVE